MTAEPVAHPPPTTSDPSRLACPNCLTLLPAPEAECRRCGGAPVESLPQLELSAPDYRFKPPGAGDYLLLAVTLLLAIAATAYPTYAAAEWLFFRGFGGGLYLLSLWNFWIWGLPIIVAAKRYHVGVMAGITEHRYLIRVFARAQLVTVGGPILGLISLVLAIMAFSFLVQIV